MKRTHLLLLVSLLLAMSSAHAQDDEIITLRDSAPDAANFEFETIVSDLTRPVYAADTGNGLLYIVEQGGIIRVFDGEKLTTFLDIEPLVSPEARGFGFTERGLLGLAFHPDFAENRLFFVYYTTPEGTSTIARYQTSDNPAIAAPDTAEIIFTLEQPFRNHNGGHIAFGPDNYLYVALGDGGSANDPQGNGQNPQTLLGTILRIDVNTEEGYTIPDDNPFVDGGGRPEIWAFGLRNPWRFSFDRATNDLYIADVGQNQWEEINFEPADSPGGVNYGWNAFEGSNVFRNNVSAPDAVAPIAEYSHRLGISVTGGYVYRGEAIPDLQGAYLYGDFGSGNIWAAFRDENGTWQDELILESGMQISSFGEDSEGELYLVNYNGSLHKFVPAE